MRLFAALLIFLVLGVVPYATLAGSMSELDIEEFEKQTEMGKTEGAKNPFAPGKPSPEALSVDDLYLTGVAVGGSGNYALISGYVFMEGDTVAGLTVKAITPEKVVLQRLDKLHTLYIGGGL